MTCILSSVEHTKKLLFFYAYLQIHTHTHIHLHYQYICQIYTFLQHIKTQVILTGNQGVVLIVSLILWPIA